MDVTLTFSREQLLYDIANYAYIEGHKREIVGGCPIAAHLITDISADGNADRVDRVLATAHAMAVEMLRALTAQPAIPETVDDRPWTPREYRIHLHLPSETSRTTVHLLSRLIHEYMVSLALADWLSITAPDLSKPWTDKAAETAAAISTAYRTASGPISRRLSPW